jgi:hypothetical protein
VTAIDAEYRIGACRMHVNKQCYVDPPTGKHYLLERGAKIIWANEIVRTHLLELTIITHFHM